MAESLIFDIDGTLWDSTELVAEGYNRQLVSEGMEGFVTAGMLRMLFGRTMTEIADRLFPRLEAEARYGLMERCMAQEGAVLRDSPCHIAYPGTVETLTELCRRHRLFLVSNSQKGYPELVVEKLGLQGVITDCLCYGDTGLWKGETLRMLMEKNRITDGVYIGDTQGDLEASRFAGIPFVFCAYGFGKPAEWDGKIEDISQLAHIY